jgi:hypothetical protein
MFFITLTLRDFAGNQTLDESAAALIVVALGFYFIEVYAPSPANPTLSAAIQQDVLPLYRTGWTCKEFCMKD